MRDFGFRAPCSEYQCAEMARALLEAYAFSSPGSETRTASRAPTLFLLELLLPLPRSCPLSLIWRLESGSYKLKALPYSASTFRSPCCFCTNSQRTLISILDAQLVGQCSAKRLSIMVLGDSNSGARLGVGSGLSRHITDEGTASVIYA